MSNFEYEVKILDIDIEKIKKTLKHLGAMYKGRKNFKRYVYDFVDNNDDSRWIRLRTDGIITTLTIKEINGEKIGDVEELEIEISDFEKGNKILNKLGYKAKGYQESIRESWEFEGIEYEIDSWPLIPTFLEIEGKSKDDVLRGINLLGLKESDCTTLGVLEVFRNYGIDLLSIKDLRF